MFEESVSARVRIATPGPDLTKPVAAPMVGVMTSGAELLYCWTIKSAPELSVGEPEPFPWMTIGVVPVTPGVTKMPPLVSVMVASRRSRAPSSTY